MWTRKCNSGSGTADEIDWQCDCSSGFTTCPSLLSLPQVLALERGYQTDPWFCRIYRIQPGGWEWSGTSRLFCSTFGVPNLEDTTLFFMVCQRRTTFLGCPKKDTTICHLVRSVGREEFCFAYRKEQLRVVPILRAPVSGWFKGKSQGQLPLGWSRILTHTRLIRPGRSCAHLHVHMRSK